MVASTLGTRNFSQFQTGAAGAVDSEPSARNRSATSLGRHIKVGGPMKAEIWDMEL